MKLDEKATIKNATKVLEQYKALKKVAGEKFVSKVTATYSFEPRSYTGTVHKPIEEHVARQETAKHYVDKIEKAINCFMDAHLRQVIIEKYVKNNDSDIAIYVDLNYSETEFYRMVERAKIEFAYYYDNGSLLRYEQGQNIKDLFDFLGEL